MYHFDSCFMGENLVIGTYSVGKGRLVNVVSRWITMCSVKIKEFYKRKEMVVREQLALSAIKVSWRSSLSK